MNLSRWFIASVIAGVAIILCALGLIPIVGNEMNEVLLNHGLPPLSTLAMVYFPLVSLAMGFVLIWLFIVFNDRYQNFFIGVLVSATLVWFLAYFLANVSMVIYGFMPVKLTVIGTVWGLLELWVAGFLGGRFYLAGNPTAQ